MSTDSKYLELASRRLDLRFANAPQVQIYADDDCNLNMPTACPPFWNASSRAIAPQQHTRQLQQLHRPQTWRPSVNSCSSSGA